MDLTSRPVQQKDLVQVIHGLFVFLGGRFTFTWLSFAKNMARNKNFVFCSSFQILILVLFQIAEEAASILWVVSRPHHEPVLPTLNALPLSVGLESLPFSLNFYCLLKLKVGISLELGRGSSEIPWKQLRTPLGTQCVLNCFPGTRCNFSPQRRCTAELSCWLHLQLLWDLLFLKQFGALVLLQHRVPLALIPKFSLRNRQLHNTWSFVSLG